MTKGQKVALGCGCAVLLAGAAIAVFLGVGAFWAKSKLHDVKGRLDKAGAQAEKIEALERQANANPYTPPADGVISEARLLKFLEVRKHVFAVYQLHQADLAALEKKTHGSREPSFSDVMAAGGKVAELFGAIRLAQAQALADVGMNEAEYHDIQLAVYKSAWASESQKESGKTPAEAMREAAEQMQRGAEQAGAEGQGALSAEDRRKLNQGMSQLGAAAKVLEVPPANVALFRKHETEIKKYAMSGLGMIGL
jgi:hypothetical protein